ncbi:MAG: hypothetical protein L6R41_008412 [Letrouitia leprolyta]|nr:MAG: hypothetical protein L6R41_008412 [Letrouitia leprolyta]
MRTLVISLPLLFSSFLFIIFQVVIAKPIDSPLRPSNDFNAIGFRAPNLHTANPPSINTRSLSKRAPPTQLPGGAYCIFEEHYVSFSNIPAAAQSLQAFYRWILEALDQPRYANINTAVLYIQDGPFELWFRPHRNNGNVMIPIFLVKQFVQLMLQRAERGWAMKYSGQVYEPNGAVFEMLIQLARPLAMSILDSAMDMHGH